MRKISLILAVCSAVISAPVFAQNVTYACQYIKSGGLNWKNKNWQITNFNLLPPFFLQSTQTSSDPKITSDSLIKALANGMLTGVFCHQTINGIQACGDSVGGSFIFNFNTMNGAISQILGGSMSDNNPEKDSLVVKTFTCTKM